MDFEENERVQKKKSNHFVNFLMGILILLMPLTIGMMVIKPEIIEMLVASKTDILKGAVIGVGILPVFLFVTIKGGEAWARKFWTWLLIGISCTMLVGIMFMTEPSNGMNDMQMDPYNMDMGVNGWK